MSLTSLVFGGACSTALASYHVDQPVLAFTDVVLLVHVHSPIWLSTTAYECMVVRESCNILCEATQNPGCIVFSISCKYELQ